MSTRLDNLPVRPGMGNMPRIGDDLSYYLRVMARYWPLIGGVAVIAALSALALTVLRPAAYSANATLLVTPPVYYWRFAPAIQSQVDTRRDWRDDFMSTAYDPTVVNAVIGGVGTALPENLRKPEDLVKKLQLTKAEGNQFKLAVSVPDAKLAADLANLWSKVLIERINAVYGPQRDSDNFQKALQQAQVRQAAADAKVREYRAAHGIDLAASSNAIAADAGTVYTTQGKDKQLLIVKNSLLNDYRQALDVLNTLITQADAAVAANKATSTISFELLDTPVIRKRGVLTPENVRNRPVAEVAAALRTEKATVESGYNETNNSIQQLQNQLAAELLELETLQREQVFSYEAVSQLERKVSELDAESLVENLRVSQVTPAETPVGRSATSVLRNGVMGAVVGLVFGALLALLLDYLFPRPQVA